MCAYACRPGQGSEPGAGWAWARAAARQHEVWVLTHSANAAAIEAELAKDDSLTRLHPVYLHNTGWVGSLSRRGPARFLYYLVWQLFLCRREAARLHATIGFDICHHVTYAADWAPTGVSRLPGVPFVWGPIGGSSTRQSPRLWARLGGRAILSESTRALVLAAFRSIVGRRLARRAAVILGQNPDVARAFAPEPVIVEPHIALEAVEGDSTRRVDPGSPPLAVFAGRLLGWKGIRLALAALREPEAVAWRLDVYGEGPQRAQLERLALRWQVASRVRFLGARSRAEVDEALARADVLFLPSIHDAAGWSVAEAMAAGCPVLALDIGGPAALVGAEDGILVDPRGDVVSDLAAGLDRARGLSPRRDRWSAERLPALISATYQQAARCGAVREAAR
jgi:glycosyltransferase involved in cell wall biosynthesis